MKKILIVAAHPDDEILGCGGVMARMAAQGSEVKVLILGEGITSRQDVRCQARAHDELDHLKKCALNANKMLGVGDVVFQNMPDNRFDEIALLDVVKIIEKVKDDFNPDTVFMHYYEDLNVDHRIAAEAVMIATRPMPGESVREVYSFEVLSSTEWRYPTSFSPDTFFDISGFMECKEKALMCYATEMRDFPHPRSIESVRLNNQMHAIKSGCRHYAEAFKLIRRVV